MFTHGTCSARSQTDHSNHSSLPMPAVARVTAALAPAGLLPAQASLLPALSVRQCCHGRQNPFPGRPQSAGSLGGPAVECGRRGRPPRGTGTTRHPLQQREFRPCRRRRRRRLRRHCRHFEMSVWLWPPHRGRGPAPTIQAGVRRPPQWVSKGYRAGAARGGVCRVLAALQQRGRAPPAGRAVRRRVGHAHRARARAGYACRGAAGHAVAWPYAAGRSGTVVATTRRPSRLGQRLQGRLPPADLLPAAHSACGEQSSWFHGWRPPRQAQRTRLS
jgi:hypothetical protein